MKAVSDIVVIMRDGWLAACHVGRHDVAVSWWKKNKEKRGKEVNEFLERFHERGGERRKGCNLETNTRERNRKRVAALYFNPPSSKFPFSCSVILMGLYFF
jgi:hypothetical protein